MISEITERFSWGTVLFIPNVLVAQPDKATWKTDITEYATEHRPSFSSLDAELELCNLKWNIADRASL
jgi:hypothetical protein